MRTNIEYTGRRLLPGVCLSLALALGAAGCSEPTAAKPVPDVLAPQIAVASPASDFSTVDSAVTVEAVVTDSGKVARASYTLNDGPAQQIPLTAAVTVTLRFEVKALHTGTNAIVLRVEDASGNVGEKRLDVGRRALPSLRIVSPAEGDTVWGHALAIKAVVGGISYLDPVAVRVNGGSAQGITNPLLYGDSVAQGEAADLVPGVNTVVFQVTDAQGHTAERTVHVVAAVPSVSYSVTTLVMPGAATSFATDMNNAGTVTGRWVGSDGQSHGVAWNGAAGTALDPLVAAAAINQHGRMVGNAPDGTYVWEQGVATQVPVGRRVDAIDINDAGEILFASAVVWRRNGQLAPVSTLGVPEGPQTVVALNAAGDVVGSTFWANSYPRIWAADGALRNVSTNGRTNAATGMNEAGQVIGWAVPQGQSSRGFFSAGGSAYVDLNTVVGAATTATALSANGTVAGTYQLQGQTRVYRFRNGRTADVVLAEAGWTIDSVVAVNDAGQIAVNAHKGSGPATALLLTPIS